VDSGVERAGELSCRESPWVGAIARSLPDPELIALFDPPDVQAAAVLRTKTVTSKDKDLVSFI
jgi:hypothetical protein